MNRVKLLYIIAFLSNILYFIIESPIIWCLIFGLQTVLILHIYHGNYSTNTEHQIKWYIYLIFFMGQILGVFYAINLIFDNIIISLILTFILTSEIWIIEAIRNYRKKNK